VKGLEARLRRAEAAISGAGAVHVIRFPQHLQGDALARWKAEAVAGIPAAALVVMVPLCGAEGGQHAGTVQ
jgi:hypothetical protein